MGAVNVLEADEHLVQEQLYVLVRQELRRPDQLVEIGIDKLEHLSIDRTQERRTARREGEQKTKGASSNQSHARVCFLAETNTQTKTDARGGSLGAGLTTGCTHTYILLCIRLYIRLFRVLGRGESVDASMLGWMLSRGCAGDGARLYFHCCTAVKTYRMILLHTIRVCCPLSRRAWRVLLASGSGRWRSAPKTVTARADEHRIESSTVVL